MNICLDWRLGFQGFGTASEFPNLTTLTILIILQLLFKK